jgi:proline iminopeptidase
MFAALKFARPALAVTLACAAATAIPDARAAERAAVPVQYWSLPTGSRIAYARVPATGATRHPPIVFVHGGPGACEVYAYAFALPWYERLAQQGFDVYLYDQIGSGFSARLADPRDYTMARHLADLEAIRQQIGSERLILVGESHGATLSARFLATRLEQVERVIFVAPGALDPAARKAEIFPHATLCVAPEYLAWADATRGADTLTRLRQLDALLRRDVVAAHAFAGDTEMDRLFEAFIKERILRTCVRDPARLRERNFEIPGMGWWASTMTTWDGVTRAADVKARLATCLTPTLILRGDADYLPADIAEEYAATLPNAKLTHIPAAGHFIWMDRPDDYCREIEAFLGISPPARVAHRNEL